MRSPQYKFSVFTFDSAAGVLKRNDHLLRVPPQTIVLLKALLEKAGTVLTREDLRQLLWPDGELIDHERAINRAMNYLRSVLRDDSKKPQFIETLHKRGYRFIAEISYVPFEADTPSELNLKVPRPHNGLAISTAERAPEAEGFEDRRLGWNGPGRMAGELPTQPRAINLQAASLAAPSRADDAPSESRPLLYTGETFGPATRNVRASPFRSLTRWSVRSALSICRPAIGYGLGFGTMAVLMAAVFIPRDGKPLLKDRSMGIVPFEVHGIQAEELERSLRMDLSDTLAQLPELQLHASDSLKSVKTDNASLMAVSKSMHLDWLLLGKLTVEDNQCVLRLELVRGSDALHLSSYRYSGTVQELATIRDKAQHDIFGGLQLAGNSAQASARGAQDFGRPQP